MTAVRAAPRTERTRHERRTADATSGRATSRRAPTRTPSGPRRADPSTARPLPQESVGPRLRLARPAAGRELGWRATITFCIVGTFAALVVSVAVQGQRIALQEQADRVAAGTATARDHNRDLRIEVIQAESPEHVLGVAHDSGLVEPGPVAVVPAAVPPADPTGAAATTAPSDPHAGATRSTPPTLAGTVPAKAG